MTDPTPTTPTTLRDQMIMILAQLQGVNNASLSSLLTESQFDSAIALTNTRLADIHDAVNALNARVDTIQAVLGADPYSSTETGNIRAILLSLLSAQGNSGIAPDNAGDAIGAAVTVTQNGRRYVVWGSPIEGLTRSNNNIDLTPVVDWTGYSLYVQTSAEDCWVGANQGVPTNSWLEAPLTGTVQVSVASNYAVKAFLRIPAHAGDTYVSQQRSAITAPAATYHIIVWPDTIPATNISPTGVNRWGARVYRTGNFNGWKVRVRSGSNVTLDLYNGTTGTVVNITSTIYTIVQTTTVVVIYSTTLAQFSIEMYQ